MRPAIVSVPVRGGPRLNSKRYTTVPFPVPEEPEAMVIHETLLAAVHRHVLVVDTVTEPAPSLGGAPSISGEIEYVHAGGAGGVGDGGAGAGGTGAGLDACVMSNR